MAEVFFIYFFMKGVKKREKNVEDTLSLSCAIKRLLASGV